MSPRDFLNCVTRDPDTAPLHPRRRLVSESSRPTRPAPANVLPLTPRARCPPQVPSRCRPNARSTSFGSPCSVPRRPQPFQQPPDILPDRPHLPLLIPLGAPHMLPRPVLDLLQFGSRLLPLHLAGAIILNDRLAPAPCRRHFPGPLRVIPPQVPLLFDHRITQSPVRQLAPVHRLGRRIQQQHRHTMTPPFHPTTRFPSRRTPAATPGTPSAADTAAPEPHPTSQLPPVRRFRSLRTQGFAQRPPPARALPAETAQSPPAAQASPAQRAAENQLRRLCSSL